MVRILGRVWACAVLAVLCPACSPRPNDVQAPQRPMELRPFDSVKRAGSDLRSFLFKWVDLPHLIKLADKEYTRQAVLDHFERLKFDPSRLTLQEGSDVRVYFVGEGSGYTDSLCVNMDGVGPDEGLPKLLFPNANTKVPLDRSAALMRKRRAFGQWSFGDRSEAEPLRPGDFVDLGTVPAGKTLSFFLIVNGEQAYTPIAERNPDQKAHMVGMAVENSPYVLISFEDMFGLGDADFEDAVFAVEVSNGNVEALLGRFDPWGKAKRLAKWIVLLAAVIGAPIAAAAARRQALRRRWLGHCREAERLLAERRPSDALTAARKAEQHARSRAEKGQSRELIVAASAACGDLAGLSDLYDKTPELFSQNEAASLAIGRTQLATDRPDAYGTLRRTWEKRETAVSAWLALDCDALVRAGRPADARELLEKTQFAGRNDAPRLARLASLLAETAPAEAEEQAARAAALHPALADVHLLRAEILEGHGKLQSAHAAFSAALDAAPADPIARDRLARFHCRVGRYSAAVQVWQAGLRPPSLDLIWTQFLFWSRVACEMPLDRASLEPPPGALRPLIDYLTGLEPERFWNTARFNAVAKRHPVLLARQEVHWLRILESLRVQHETEARWLLSFERDGRESWHPSLETALLRIVLFRQTGSLGPFRLEKEDMPFQYLPQHPFFAQLEQCAQNNAESLPGPLAAFLKSDCVFAAACFAAGWTQAGIRLARNITIDSSAPEWTAPFWKSVR